VRAKALGPAEIHIADGRVWAVTSLSLPATNSTAPPVLVVQFGDTTWTVNVGNGTCPCTSGVYDLHNVGYLDVWSGKYVGFFQGQLTTLAARFVGDFASGNSEFTIGLPAAGAYAFVLAFHDQLPIAVAPSFAPAVEAPQTPTCVPPPESYLWTDDAFGAFEARCDQGDGRSLPQAEETNAGLACAAPDASNGSEVSPGPTQGGNPNGPGVAVGVSCSHEDLYCPTPLPPSANASAEARYAWASSHCAPPPNCPAFPPFANGSYAEQVDAVKSWIAAVCRPLDSNQGTLTCGQADGTVAIPAGLSSSDAYAWAKTHCGRPPGCVAFPPYEFRLWNESERALWRSKECRPEPRCVPATPRAGWTDAQRRAWIREVFDCVPPPDCSGNAPPDASNLSLAEFETLYKSRCGIPACNALTPYWTVLGELAPSEVRTQCQSACAQMGSLSGNLTANTTEYSPCAPPPLPDLGSAVPGAGDNGIGNATNGSRRVVVPGFDGDFAVLGIAGAALVAILRRR
jgi:hypothetical protein